MRPLARHGNEFKIVSKARVDAKESCAKNGFLFFCQR